MKNTLFILEKRPHWRAFFMGTVLLLSSCGLIKVRDDWRIIENSEIKGELRRDYRDQLASLKKELLGNGRVRVRKLSQKNRDYLTEVYRRIISNNELFLKGNYKSTPSFSIIDTSTPFIFSLPKNQFFISRGLIKKYFNNESLLVSALCFEIVKSKRDIYYKKMIIPTGAMSVRRAIALTRVSLGDRMDIYKWTYYALRRAEYDAPALLNWIQIQNKNTLDFSWMIADSRTITREEYEFKGFLARRGIVPNDLPSSNSTKSFYSFKDSL